MHGICPGIFCVSSWILITDHDYESNLESTIAVKIAYTLREVVEKVGLAKLDKAYQTPSAR